MILLYHFLYCWTIFWSGWYIFYEISALKLPRKKLLGVSLFSTLVIYLGSLSGLVTDALHLFIIEWLFFGFLSIKQKIFYPIYTSLSLDFLLRLLYSLTFNGTPSPVYALSEPRWDLLVVNLLVIPIYWCIRKIFNLDFQAVTDERDEKIRALFTRMTVLLTVYYLYLHLIYMVSFLDNPLVTWIKAHHNLVVFWGLSSLAWILYGLSRWARSRLQSDLEFDRQQHINSLESYNHRVEALYDELSTFKQDYQQSLAELAKSIASRDMTHVKATYEQILGEAKPSKLNQTDVAKLVNIQVSPIKSMLSSKIFQAQEAGLDVSVEAPDEISQIPMKIIDLVTIIGILSDNAIEAARDSQDKSLSLAYFVVDNQQFFVIENSTKEERVPISRIFENGYSSKGDNRGIGLANVEEIISEYDNVNLSTRSEDYLFRQTLSMTIKNPASQA